MSRLSGYAGGSVGRHLIDQLLKNGKHIVTAITRPSSTNKMPEGVQIARVDYASDDDTALVEVLRGQQVLLITMNVMAPPDTMIKLIRAAAKAGVPYIEPNWYGHDAANDSLCDDSLLSPNRDRVITEITRLGVSSYLSLVCNFWYEFSVGGGPDQFGFDFIKRSLTLYDGGDVPINTSTWPQTSRAIAKLLSLKELPEDENDQSPTLSQFRNRSVPRMRTGLFTQDSVAERFKEGQEGMKVHNWNVFTKMLYSRMFFANGDGDYESRRGLDNELLGLLVEDLDEATAEGIRMAENNEVPFSH
ncbi:hypothetical protein N7449_005928 [Penicillium cf. viridicatum]|uniref:NAD(P)-binding domain-containing protein n=1 Tax=Penicillium cf. viridicatum TaxID=2972119 RepID=A0A9W9SWQ7_9EURO|nr:hypothetical protein N7449_005928 [Penicillium cf. viridicatum]